MICEWWTENDLEGSIHGLTGVILCACWLWRLMKTMNTFAEGSQCPSWDSDLAHCITSLWALPLHHPSWFYFCIFQKWQFDCNNADVTFSMHVLCIATDKCSICYGCGLKKTQFLLQVCSIEQELNYLQKLNHENLVQYISMKHVQEKECLVIYILQVSQLQ
jgi:hypothetical protein